MAAPRKYFEISPYESFARSRVVSPASRHGQTGPVGPAMAALPSAFQPHPGDSGIPPFALSPDVTRP